MNPQVVSINPTDILLYGGLISLVSSVLTTLFNYFLQNTRDQKIHDNQLERDKLKFSSQRDREIEEEKIESRKIKRDQIEEIFQEWIQWSYLVQWTPNATTDVAPVALSHAKLSLRIPNSILLLIQKHSRLALKGEIKSADSTSEITHEMRSFLAKLENEIYPS